MQNSILVKALGQLKVSMTMQHGYAVACVMESESTLQL